MIPLGRIGPRLMATEPERVEVRLNRPPSAELWAFFAGVLSGLAIAFVWLMVGG